MYCVNNCLELFTSTFDKMIQSNFLNSVENLFVNLVGIDVNKYVDVVSAKHPKIKVSTNYTEHSGEMDTLKMLWDFCQTKENFNVLYLHSKGASRPGNVNVKSWVDYMEYFLIEKWNQCVDALEHYDTCGVNLQDFPGNHYSGNFWWANSSFIKKLKRFDVINCEVSRLPYYAQDLTRAYCEFWLLDNNFYKAHSFHNSNVDHYGSTYERSKYAT